MADEIRAGMVGFDTSHTVAFAKILNDRNHDFHVPGCRVVAGVRAGSPDVPASADRIEKFTKTLTEEMGLKIYDTVEELVENVDAVLIESVDGRPHRAQAEPVLAARKPLFIDKPLTASLEDARAIRRLAAEAGTEVFSGSSLRWDVDIAGAAASGGGGAVLGCDAVGPASLEPTNPGLFWYGVHAVEILYTFMGPGCRSVCSVVQENSEMAIGTWADGRLGTVRGIRKGKGGYGARVLREEKIVNVASNPHFPAYARLLKEVVKFFRTGKSPVPLAEVVEMMAFMEAAHQSGQQGGAPQELGTLE